MKNLLYIFIFLLSLILFGAILTTSGRDFISHHDPIRIGRQLSNDLQFLDRLAEIPHAILTENTNLDEVLERKVVFAPALLFGVLWSLYLSCSLRPTPHTLYAEPSLTQFIYRSFSGRSPPLL